LKLNVQPPLAVVWQALKFVHTKTQGAKKYFVLLSLYLGSRIVTFAAPGDENWDSNFGVPGASAPVSVMAVVGQTLYAGGRFWQIGEVDAYNIAQWDGTNWSPLGLGVDGPVTAIVASGSDLYVGGSFSQAGDIPAANIAKWDGTNWSALGSGIDGNRSVKLAVVGDKLFAGGLFSSAGETAATNIAMWDGSSWTNLGDGVNGQVTALAADGTNLYVGGGFTRAGSVAAKYVAHWDGKCWSPMGDPDIHLPAAIRLKGSEVFLFGNGGSSVFQPAVISRWDGFTWNQIARFSPEGCLECKADTRDMIILGDDFYLLMPGLGKWDGTNLVGLGSGSSVPNPPPLSGSVVSLASNGSELFVGGDFSWAGGKPSSNIALWHIPHALSASRSENVLTLSWPATGTNFILESSKSLSQADWAEVPQTPIVNGNKLTVTNEVLSTQKFYRLRRR